MVRQQILPSLPLVKSLFKAAYNRKENGSTEFPHLGIAIPNMFYTSGKIFEGKKLGSLAGNDSLKESVSKGNFHKISLQELIKQNNYLK